MNGSTTMERCAASAGFTGGRDEQPVGCRRQKIPCAATAITSERDEPAAWSASCFA